MSEVINVYHATGATSPAALFILTQPTTFNGLGAANSRVVLTRIDPFGGTSDGAGIPIPILTSITGSSSAQSINVSTSAFLGTGGPVILDAGNSNQEVILASVTDPTHIHGIALNNHAAGTCYTQKVFSIFTKYLLASVPAPPSPNGIGNYGFIRMTDLPANVFDQYVIRGTFGTLDFEWDDTIVWHSGSGVGTPTAVPPVPRYDSASLSATGNPTNKVLLESGPITGGGAIFTNIQVQLIFTTTPEPFTVALNYGYFWDDL